MKVILFKFNFVFFWKLSWSRQLYWMIFCRCHWSNGNSKESSGSRKWPDFGVNGILANKIASIFQNRLNRRGFCLVHICWRHIGQPNICKFQRAFPFSSKSKRLWPLVAVAGGVGKCLEVKSEQSSLFYSPGNMHLALPASTFTWTTQACH